MKKASLILAICTALAATYILGRWVSVYPQTKNANDFLVWRDNLSPDGSVSTEWAFFGYADFPTGKCEILFDVPVSTIGLVLLGISAASGCIFIKLHRKQIRAP